jgi:hypothetical protein
VSRADIAAALTAAGVAGHEEMPATITAGQGWPEWVSTRYDETSGGCQPAITEWVVWLVLPPYNTAAEADSVRDTVAASLGAVAAVDQARPALITVTDGGGNTIPAIQYQIRTAP